MELSTAPSPELQPRAILWRTAMPVGVSEGKVLARVHRDAGAAADVDAHVPQPTRPADAERVGGRVHRGLEFASLSPRP